MADSALNGALTYLQASDANMNEGPTAFLDWAAAYGFRRLGEVSASALSMAENLHDGCVYAFVIEGSLLYVGETGGSLRERMADICRWMRKDEPRARVFRAVCGDSFDIWARPQQSVPTLDCTAPDRWAVESVIICKWHPAFNRRGVLRSTSKLRA